MKTISCFLVILVLQQVIGGIVRKPPAFSTPMYSDSYLPAAMQVIFHAVEQLKLVQSEETLESTVTSISTSPISPSAQNQQIGIQGSSTVSEITTEAVEESQKGEGNTTKGIENSTKSSEISEEPMEMVLVTKVSSSESIGGNSDHRESPEVNEEAPETEYATPETNYEAPEDVHGVQETNEEVPEENYEGSSLPIDMEFASDADANTKGTKNPPNLIEIESEQETKEPTVESVVQEIYEIVKPIPSEFSNESTEPSDKSKGITGISVEKMDSIEEEEDETRYTRLGEKVTQVPRPSLTSYLRRAKVPPSATLQQLASLYDSLSKDARKQGFGKYTGYSDEILNVLRTSVEGGIGPQLKKLLDKVIERNELTREDAKMKTVQAIRDLENPSSSLSKDFKPLLPLRYSV